MKKQLLVSRAAFCATLAAAMTAAARSQTPLTPVRVTSIMVEDVAPVFYALNNGIFRKYGLDVHFDPATAGAAVVAAVTAGAYEFGKGSVVSAFRAVSRGIPLVAVAPGWIFEEKTPSAEMIVAVDATYRTGADLSGKTIAVSSLNELNQVAAMAWVDQHGGDAKSLKFVELPVVASAAAVAAHRIDATVLLEPALSAALSLGTVRSIGSAFAAIAPSFPVSVWLTNRTFAAEHPAQVKGFARSLAEASEYLNAHPEMSEQLLSSAMHVPLETLQKMKHVRAGTTLSARMLVPLLLASQKYVAMPKIALDDFIVDATGR